MDPCGVACGSGDDGGGSGVQSMLTWAWDSDHQAAVDLRVAW